MKHFGACRLDTLNQTLWRDDALLSLPPRPYAVLQYLVEHPDRLITHNEFMEALWPGTYVQPQVLRTYVLELRKLLGDDAANPHFIASVPKRGYRFLAPVTEAAHNSPRVARTARSNDDPALSRPVEIVGRAAELAKLDAFMRRACDGERQVLFISGERGIGKTALVDAFCKNGCGDARVGRGQSVEHFASREPLYPVKELLRDLTSLCGADKGDKTLHLLARVASGLHDAQGSPGSQGNSVAHVSERKSAASASVPATPLANAAPAPAREQTPGDICEALDAMAQETPLLLVFEDLQWADEATLNLFSTLARRRGPARLMVIATCRSSAGRAASGLGNDRRGSPAGAETGEPSAASVPSLRALKQDLVMRRLGTVISLEPLSKAAVRQYVDHQLANQTAAKYDTARSDGSHSETQKMQEELVPAGLVTFLHEQSNGNPLFLCALFDHLIAERVLLAGVAGWSLRGSLSASAIGVPAPLREMIELETESLSIAEQRLLEAASIAGVVFPVWAAAASLTGGIGGDMTEVEEQFEALARQVHFIRNAGHDELPDGARSTSYVFAHPYYREVLYHRQPEVRRSRGHQRVAERLGILFAGDENSVAAEIANHYEAAGNWKSAAKTLAGMAGVAAHAGYHDDAREKVARALELLGNLGVRERNPLEAEIREQLRGLAAATKKASLSPRANPLAKVRGKKTGGADDRNRTQKKPGKSAVAH